MARRRGGRAHRLPRRARRRQRRARSTCAHATRRPRSSPSTARRSPTSAPAMVVGSGSESYRTLRYLVERLPVMIAPAWLSTETQPIGLEDVLSLPGARAGGRGVEGPRGRDRRARTCSAYADMLDAMADALGKRHRPRLKVPLLTPWLSSLWIGLVTPVDAGVARPLIEGLRTRTVVEDPTGAALFPVTPQPFARGAARGARGRAALAYPAARERRRDRGRDERRSARHHRRGPSGAVRQSLPLGHGRGDVGEVAAEAGGEPGQRRASSAATRAALPRAGAPRARRVPAGRHGRPRAPQCPRASLRVSRSGAAISAAP